MTPEELAVHEGFMRRALELAERGRWSTAPNPTVGAVLVKDGAVAAEGWHQVCGQAHAEVNCLRDAASKGVDPRGGTLYVTLEPCNHFGKTPPCSHAVLEAGISRVVIGMLDPNAKAAGGADFLREHGVEVVSGVLEQECRDLVADFLVWQTTRRPYVILKMASTLDGRRFKVLEARVVEGSGEPGRLFACGNGLGVYCGEGALQLVTVQLEGSRAMAAQDFLRGHPLTGEQVLGR